MKHGRAECLQRLQPEAQAGLRAVALAGELRIRVGGARVCGIAPLLPVQVYAGVGGVAEARFFSLGLRLETLQAGPDVDERSIDGECASLAKPCSHAMATTRAKNTSATRWASRRF